MVITRRSLEFLPVAYERGEYTLPSGSSASPEERSAEVKEKEERLFRLELSQLHILYRKMLFDTVSIPHAGQVHHDLVYWVNQIAKDVQRILWPTADLREFKESLFQVVSRSFNSPSVMRALFYVHAMLGELTEALQALHAYLYLVGLISQATDDIKGTGEASLLGKDGVMRAVPSNHEGMLRELVRDSVEDNASQEGADENRRSMAAHRSSEQEPPVEILRVLLSAARLCCTDLDEPVKAVELAKLALLELQVRPTDRECQVLAGAVHRVAGAAYSFQASKTIDPDRRPEFHRTAKKYILQAVEIDGEAWQSWYQLALERCQSRDIEHGIDAIVKALQLNASHIPSWHLLALALSCPKIRSNNPDALIKALESCDAGLRVPLDGIWATDEDLGWQPNYEQFVERLELQVTRALVLSKIEGYDSALGALQNAFAAFASLPPEHQQQMSSGAGDVAYTHGPLAVTSGSLYNLSEAELSGSFASGQVSAVPNDQRQPQQQGSLPNLPQTQQTRAGLMQKTDSSDPSVQTAPAARPSKEQYGIRLFRHRNTGSKTRGTQPAQASVLSVQTTPTIAPTSAAGGTATAPQAGMDAQKLRPSARCRTRQKGSARLLCDLWLVAARLYLQQQRWDEALKAVEEAEQIEWSTYADLWCVLGQVRFAQPPQDEENSLTTAIACFLKGLACDTNDVGCRLWLARACTAVQQDTMAQGILDRLTRGPGWDCPEAWFFLGRIHDEHGRAERAKECFLYALELERSQPIRSFSRVSRFPGYFWHLGEV
ncbi:hypothetical protein BCR43DRAFT_479395 [Syncephalastrum racemosum]|uniref:Uncharacterized protein n=1 Tax=Syncephalastrum racemosum TaxID=13706 RepID=A0A1X2H336_SYNRA|nr:hypothetical protein BCR43DRAFT_479395 [Syncephalastrum racemosum]